MKRLLCRIAMCVSVVCLLPPAVHGEIQTIPLGPGGSLELDVPDGWSLQFHDEDDPSGAAIELTPPRDVPLSLLLTPMPMSPEVADPLQEVRRAVVEEAQPRIAAVAEEEEVPVQELQGVSCNGFYVSATDRTVTHPTRDDFRFIDQGAVAAGRLPITFTVLTNAGDAPERREALDIVRSARHVPPERTIPDDSGTVRLRHGSQNWVLAIDLPGFDLEPVERYEGEKKVRLEAHHPETGLMLTLFLEEAQPRRSAVGYRDWILDGLRKQPPKELDVERWEQEGIALLSYRIKPLGQVNWNAEIVRDSVWVDVHVSKARYRPEDREHFAAVINSIRLEPLPRGRGSRL